MKLAYFTVRHHFSILFLALEKKVSDLDDSLKEKQEELHTLMSYKVSILISKVVCLL